jgi:hypothetical protein
MKPIIFLILCLITISAEEISSTKSEHQIGTNKVAIAQDSLSADVQQLKVEQTQQGVIKLLDQVESIMQDAINQLEKENTGGETIAAQTEVIEKMYQAAKSKQNQGQSAQGMMEMMKSMMGEGFELQGEKKESKQSQANNADSSNLDKTKISGKDDGQTYEERRIPKATGSNSKNFPEEFKKALDIYNRALQK